MCRVPKKLRQRNGAGDADKKKEVSGFQGFMVKGFHGLRDLLSNLKYYFKATTNRVNLKPETLVYLYKVFILLPTLHHHKLAV